MRVQKSLLLDLYASNIPNRLTSMTNVLNTNSKHQGISCILQTKGVHKVPKYFIIRDYSKVNNSNNQPMINQCDQLQLLFWDSSLESISTKLNDGLNNVFKSLIPVKAFSIVQERPHTGTQACKSQRKV